MNHDLPLGAGYIAEQWYIIGTVACRLDAVTGGRTPDESMALEIGTVYYRSLVNFCCGNFRGNRHDDDIKPSDFLGTDWWPPDEELDRRLRGRLPTINRTLAHLSWHRPDIYAMWPFGQLAHEVHHVLTEFVAEAESRTSDGAEWLATLQVARTHVGHTLPERRSWRATAVEPAPARSAGQ